MTRQNFDGTESSIASRCEPLYEAREYPNVRDSDDCEAHARDAREAKLEGYALRFDPDTGITWKIDPEGNKIGKHKVRQYPGAEDQSPAELLMDILTLIVKLFHKMSDEPLPQGFLTRLYQELAESLPKENKP